MYLHIQEEKFKSVLGQIENLFSDPRFKLFSDNNKLTVIDLVIYKSSDFARLTKKNQNYIKGLINGKLEG